MRTCWFHDWEILESTNRHDLTQDIQNEINGFYGPRTSMPWTPHRDQFYNRVCLKCQTVDLQIDRAKIDIREKLEQKERRQKEACKLAGKKWVPPVSIAETLKQMRPATPPPPPPKRKNK